MTNGDGIAGFGGDAKLMVIKAGGGDGAFTDVDEAAAISYAVDHGARIINLSFGGTTTSTTEKNAIDYATSHGVLVVAAGGNHYLNGNDHLPGRARAAARVERHGGTGLAVAASTATGARAAFSSTGSYVSLAAPGDGVFSAVSSTSSASNFPRVSLPGSLRGLYGYGSGTSFAAPEVSGAAALVMAANPLLDADDVARSSRTPRPAEATGHPSSASASSTSRGGRRRAGAPTPEAAHAGLKLVACTSRSVVTLTAQLSSSSPRFATARRSLVFTATTRRGGPKSVGTCATGASGRLALAWQARTPLKLRARWAGATDLAAAASKTVTVKARR